MITRDLNIITVEVNGKRLDKRGGYLQTHCIVHDVTQKKRSEIRLEEKSVYLDNILTSATEYAIATTDLDFRITYYNPIAAKLHGYTAKEVIGRTVQEMHTRENVEHERFDKAVENVRTTAI